MFGQGEFVWPFTTLIDTENIKITQKSFSHYKEKRAVEAFHTVLNSAAPNRIEGRMSIGTRLLFQTTTFNLIIHTHTYGHATSTHYFVFQMRPLFIPTF